jgi:hypothetical protein
MEHEDGAYVFPKSLKIPVRVLPVFNFEDMDNQHIIMD